SQTPAYKQYCMPDGFYNVLLSKAGFISVGSPDGISSLRFTSLNLVHCPAEDFRSTTQNYNLSHFCPSLNLSVDSTTGTGTRKYRLIRKIRYPENKVWLMDSKPNALYINANVSTSTDPYNPILHRGNGDLYMRHSKLANHLFFDGHVEARSVNDINPSLGPYYNYEQ
ncbi:MAG: hypothetical protein WCP55_25585, partial [Lentisphaerota bacterium]